MVATKQDTCIKCAATEEGERIRKDNYHDIMG